MRQKPVDRVFGIIAQVTAGIHPQAGGLQVPAERRRQRRGTERAAETNVMMRSVDMAGRSVRLVGKFLDGLRW